MGRRGKRRTPEALVKVWQPNSFKDFRLGFLMGACKHNDGGKIVLLVGNDLPYKELCVKEDQGDTIEVISKVTETLI